MITDPVTNGRSNVEFVSLKPWMTGWEVVIKRPSGYGFLIAFEVFCTIFTWSLDEACRILLIFNCP